jgi:ketosteroid isomerase-like protein
MKPTILLLTILFFAKMSFSQTIKPEITETIIALEKGALEKWNQGDPSGYLKISAEDVTYFDPVTEKRLEGLDNLTKYYEPIRGKVEATRYEMVSPKVKAANNIAVLTFTLHSYMGEKLSIWNCTEVYRLEPDGQWKIIHTHWSSVMNP